MAGTPFSSPDYEVKRQKVLDELQALGRDSEEIMTIIRNEDVVKEIRNDKLANLKFLEDNYGVRTRNGRGRLECLHAP